MNAIKQLSKYSSLMLFTFTFYFAMGCSRYAQVLFFQQNHGLLNYALSYSAMAVAGALSFIVSNQLVAWPLKRIVLVFAPIYALGMLLRIFPNSASIAIISGVISGVGASVCLLVIRSWIYAESDAHRDDRNLLVSSRYTIMQVASLAAIIIAGLFINLFVSSNAIYITILVGAALAMMLIALVQRIPNGRAQKPEKKAILNLPTQKRFGLSVFIVVVLLGLTNALVEPIIPAILRQTGFKISQVTFWTTTFSLATVAASLLYQYANTNHHADAKFLLNQLIVGLTICGAVFFTSVHGLFLIAILLMMSIGVAGLFIFKELMEYEMFPKNESFLYLALGQSGFLVGDAIGAPIGTFVYEQFGLHQILMIYAILTLICGVAYFALHGVMKRNKMRLENSAN